MTKIFPASQDMPQALRLFQQLFSGRGPSPKSVSSPFCQVRAGNIVPSEAVGARRLEPERAGAHRLIRAHCENLKWTLRGEPGRRAASALAAQAVLKQHFGSRAVRAERNIEGRLKAPWSL